MMKIENFAVLVRHEGVTKQVIMSADEQKMFSRIVLGTLADVNGKVVAVPIPSVELPPNYKVFPASENKPSK